MDISVIQRDFTSFADPHTLVSVDAQGVSWSQGRAERRASFSVPTKGLPDLIYEDKRFTYVEFFASEHMADLRGLAHALTHYVPQLPGFVREETYVESRAFSERLSPRPASQLLAELVKPGQSSNKTTVVFLRGRAGDGKTALLARSAFAQAQAYELGATTWLYLYVDAQGSALARIDEIIAKVTQDMRANFTYHAAATLARLGLLVPIIDGFDELLGIGGYRDAFSSLALFVSRMAGQGALVASARSTFYQFTTFGQQASRLSSDEWPLLFELTPAELLPWSEPEAAAFFEKMGQNDSLSPVKEALGSRSDEILSSPFLLSSLVRYVDLATVRDAGRHIVRQIVEAMIQREMVEKLLDPQGHPLLTLDQHKSLLGALAEEMWWQESRELDEQTFLTIGQLVCEDLGLEGAIAERFLDRMPTHALLARTENPKRVSFRHEFYFGFFLGTLIAHRVLRREPINDLVNRAVISNVVADEVAATMRFEGGNNLDDLITAIDARRPNPASADVSNQNAGTLCGALIREFGHELTGTLCRRGLFSGVDLSRTTLRGAAFEKCSFTEVDVRDCDWERVVFRSCELSMLMISAASRFHVSGLTVPGNLFSLRYSAGPGLTQETYNPGVIRDILVARGAEVEEDVQLRPLGAAGRAVADQLDRFLRIVHRSLYFSEEDFLNRRSSMRGDLREVTELLRKQRLLIPATRQIRGQRTMYRLAVPPDELRRGEAGVFTSTEVRDFWSAVRALDGEPADSRRSP